MPEASSTLDVEEVRRESGVLVGELIVRCGLPGALTCDGILSAGDVNLSSVRARQERGKYLNTRARVDEVDFIGLLEELSLRRSTPSATEGPRSSFVICSLPRRTTP